MSNGLHLLIVEDDRYTLDLLSRLIGLAGYRVAGATTCAEAIRLAKERSFDAYLFNIGLPDGDGFDLLRQLRLIHPAPGIVLSGFSSDADHQHARESGCVEYLVKPYTIEEVQAAVQRATAIAPAMGHFPQLPTEIHPGQLRTE